MQRILLTILVIVFITSAMPTEVYSLVCQPPETFGNGVLDPGEGCDFSATPNGCTPGDICDGCGKCSSLIRCDGICEVTGESCPADCGSTGGPVCGNLLCEAPLETLFTCPIDCYTVTASCGNGICEPSEACPSDCTVCGNLICEPPLETLITCPVDCYTVTASCGNGITEAGEQCDDADNNGSATSNCDENCKLISLCGNGICDIGEASTSCLLDCPPVLSVCGNSMVEDGEQCDPPNGTTCSVTCQTIVPPPPAVCGNGIPEAGEECEVNIETCSKGNTPETCTLCNACKCIPTKDYPITTPYHSYAVEHTEFLICKLQQCGNGMLQPYAFEQCDDGNTTDGDGCSANCKLESSLPSNCGNGIVESGERCDGNFGYCQHGASPLPCEVCSPTCNCVDVSTGNPLDPFVVYANAICSNLMCGDGVTQAGFGEACDDANFNNNDACLNACIDAKCGDGFVQTGVEECDDNNGNNSDTCLNTCKNAKCGDNFVRTGVEQCDDGNNVNGDGCSATCTTEGIISICGNGTTELPEECDDGNTTAGDGCSATCITEVGTSVCGNGTIESPEQCEDFNTTSNDGCSGTCQIENVCGVNQ